MEIGAQLYTVRDYCKTPADFAETLQKIAAIGYKNVQVSGTCAFDPAWLEAELKKNDLRCVLTHTPPARLQSDAAAVAQEHSVYGCDCVGLGYYPFKSDDPALDYESFVRMYCPVAETLHAYGKYFMHHNHAYEFQKRNGKTILERLAEDFAPELLGFTLDTYWIQVGGGDPAEWVERLSGRVPCIHLKDYAYGAKIAVVGEGNLNFDRIFRKAEAAGTKYMLVEQDDCGGEDPFVCLRRSYEYLKARGF